MCEYGYARISTKKQSIERQIRNILAAYPNAHIVQEVFTGTKTEGRKEWEKLYKVLKPGDTVIFDEVSRMSRNAEEGYNLYEELFTKGITLVFLKEPHINTDTYKKAINGSVAMTGTNADYILEGVNKFLLALAKEQIQLAFTQAEKEVEFLHQRTKEGIETARRNGKQIGGATGRTVVTKKSLEMKDKMQRYLKEFNGDMTDTQFMKDFQIAKNTFYKYKAQLKEEM
ncbi:MAG: recombinase family protein [Coprococcus sp.]